MAKKEDWGTSLEPPLFWWTLPPESKLLLFMGLWEMLKTIMLMEE